MSQFHGDVLDQIPQSLPDVFKLIDLRIVQLVGMEDLVNQRSLLLNRRDVGYTMYNAKLTVYLVRSMRHFEWQQPPADRQHQRSEG